MSYSRHGRCRVPVITSLHERMPNTLCVSDMVRRANLAGRNGPAYMLPSRSTDAPPARAGTPRLLSLQVRIVLIVAQQDVVARRSLLDEVVLERQASTTESVTITSRRVASSSSASWRGLIP